MKIAPLVFSGMQPTGNLHLGNYLGAMVNWLEMQKTHDCIYCVVDLHAITVWQDPAELRQAIRRDDGGLYRERHRSEEEHSFNQSQVREHAELAWIFNCVARLGWLNRMTQFKEKAGKDRENASVGLYAYPNLMAADISSIARRMCRSARIRSSISSLRATSRRNSTTISRRRSAARLCRRGSLSAARADHHRACDARHEPARRHDENVEVRSFGLFAHQSFGLPDTIGKKLKRRRPIRSPFRGREGPEGRPEAENLVAFSRRRVGSPLQEFSRIMRQQFSSFKKVLWPGSRDRKGRTHRCGGREADGRSGRDRSHSGGRFAARPCQGGAGDGQGKKGYRRLHQKLIIAAGGRCGEAKGMAASGVSLFVAESRAEPASTSSDDVP